MDSRLFLGSDKVLKCLADGPDAGIALASRAEKLNDLRRKDRRIQ
jgi:hypothetical protein